MVQGEGSTASYGKRRLDRLTLRGTMHQVRNPNTLLKRIIMNGSAIVLMFAIIILLIIFGPFLSIWAVNTLFGLTIPFTLKTWLAAIVLGGLVSGRASSSK